LGNRIASTHNGQTTQFVVDPAGLGNIVGEYDGGSILLAHYVYGLDLASRVDASNQAAYYDFDLNGNTAGLTAGAGTYVNRYRYLPYGETTTISAALPNRFQFLGAYGVHQEGNGVALMRARAYSPARGQFLSNDPLGQAGGDANLRRYTRNYPVNGIDPSGLFQSLLTDAEIVQLQNRIQKIIDSDQSRLAELQARRRNLDDQKDEDC